MSTFTVYHATSETAFLPFSPDTRIQAVYQYERDVDVDDTVAVNRALEHAFGLFNMDTDMIAHTAGCEGGDCVIIGCDRFTAESYRTTGNRSLSVGDVIVIGGPAGTTLPDGTGPGEYAWAVARSGYDRVEVLAEQILPLEDHRPAPSRLGFTVPSSELGNDWRPSTHAQRLGLDT